MWQVPEVGAGPEEAWRDVIWLQVAAVLVAVVCLAFFALFAGYYWRNRRLSLAARDRAANGERIERLTSRAGGDEVDEEPSNHDQLPGGGGPHG